MSTISEYDYLSLSMSSLKRSGLLNPEYSGKWHFFTWNEDGEEIGRAFLKVDFLESTRKRLTLKYDCEEEAIQYSLDLVSVPSNLGKGERWYFVCPRTWKRCIKLHKPPGPRYFLHREAFNMLYESQMKSRTHKQLDKTFGLRLDLEDLYRELWQPYRKKHYRGKPTPLVRKVERLYISILKNQPI